jgi:hypothetical protein
VVAPDADVVFEVDNALATAIEGEPQYRQDYAP